MHGWVELHKRADETQIEAVNTSTNDIFGGTYSRFRKYARVMTPRQDPCVHPNLWYGELIARGH